MHCDICRSETGLDTPEAVAAWNAMISAFLAHAAATPEHLSRVIELCPDAALPQATKGLMCLLLGRREMTEVARTAHRIAVKAVRQGHEPARARAMTEALGAWLDRQPSGAVFHLERILAFDPSDTLALKLSHLIRFVMGDAPGMRRSVEQALAAHDTSHPLSGYALGCHAFALEETGDYLAAERTGHLGLERAADDAWGLHAVAHVHEMLHRPAEGIALIEDNRAAWDHCNNFRYHVWWHKALLHLDLGEYDRVLALYDEKIRSEKTDDYRDIANATSLLMRLELEGVPCGGRWAELADLAETRSSDGCLVFADLHYMLALAGDARRGAAVDLARRMTSRADRRTEAGRVVAHPGIAAAEGLAAFGEGRYATAFDLMTRARAHMCTIGGSHAQRDVFERITVDAGLRAGRLDAVAAILAERTAQRAGRLDAFSESRLAAIAAAGGTSPLYAAQ